MHTSRNPHTAVYLSSSEKKDLHEAISACLCKAQAIALVIATTNVDEYNTKTVNDYLWALSDLIRDAKCLYDKQALLKA